MNLRPSRRPSARARRLALCIRGGLAAFGAAAVAAGALLGAAGGHQSGAAAARPATPAQPMQLTAASQNAYWMVASDGGIFSFGAPFYGSTGNLNLAKPIVGMAATPSGHGYWFVASDGGIFNYGDAGFYKSMGGQPLNAPIVSMARTVDGKGYWLVGSDGGIFSFGDAAFYGSTGNLHLAKPIVGMAATPTGKGYWFVASDGGIFAYGDAGFYGSMGGQPLAQPVVGMAATPDGKGYWLVARDGGIFSYGDAHFFGSTGNIHLNQPIVGMTPTQTGQGYWFVASDGGIFSYGDAQFNGSMGATPLNKPVVGMAAAPTLFSSHLAVVSSAASLVANGVSQATVTVQSLSADNAPVAGDNLSFFVPSSSCGSVSPSSGITDLNGVASFTYTASTHLGACGVDAAEVYGPEVGAASIQQVPGSPAHIAASPGAGSYSADLAGGSGIPATFTVTDASGHPVSGVSLDLSTSLAHGSVAPTSGVTNSNGTLQVAVHDTVAGESGLATATVHGGSLHGSTGQLTITAGKLDSLTTTAPTGVIAGTPYNLTFHAADHWGNAVNPASAHLATSGTACDAAPNSTAAICPAPGFSAGTDTLVGVTSYKAQTGATYTLTDSTASDTYTGSPVSGTATYDIAPGAPANLTGTSASFTTVHNGQTTTPSGLFFQSFGTPQSANITLTLTDAYGNQEVGNTDTVTVTLTHNSTATESDGGSVPATVALTDGVGTLAYTAPSKIGGNYPNNWGNGTLTWGDGAGVTAVPSAVLVTTTNVATLAGSIVGGATSYTADDVSTGTNHFQITYQALPNGGGSPQSGAMVDFKTTDFAGTPTFTDTNSGSPLNQDVTGIPTGGSTAQLTVFPHPTDVPDPVNGTTGTVKAWMDGSPATDANYNTPTPTITVTTGSVSQVTLAQVVGQTTQVPPSTWTVGQELDLQAAATDAEGNVTIPNEAFTGSFNHNESNTCNSVTNTASAGIANHWDTLGHATATFIGYVPVQGLQITYTGAVHTGVTTVLTIQNLPGNPAALTWTLAPTTFTADAGNTGQSYGVNAVDAYCNAVLEYPITISQKTASDLPHGTLAAGVTTNRAGSVAFPGVVDTLNGSNGSVPGRAVFTLFDSTVEGGTLVASAYDSNHALLVSADSPAISITAGKPAAFSIATPTSPKVGTQYQTTVTATDSFGNLVNPANAVVDTVNSTALNAGPADNGTKATATLGAFSGGHATLTSTPFDALSGAVLAVSDTTSEALNSSATGTSSAFNIAAGDAAILYTTSSSSDFASPTFTAKTSGEACTFSVQVADAHGNVVTATNQADTVTVTLTGTPTSGLNGPDGGFLSAPGQTGTGADGSGTSVQLTISLVGGTGTFTYHWPSSVPLPTQSGTITLTDTPTGTDPTLSGNPATITVQG